MSSCLREQVSELEQQLRSQQSVWQDRLGAREAEVRELKSSLEQTTTTLAACQEDFQRRWEGRGREGGGRRGGEDLVQFGCHSIDTLNWTEE